MHLNPHHYRALLVTQTEHLDEATQDAITASLALARDLARVFARTDPAHWNTHNPATWGLGVEAVALKLLTIGDLPRWVRVLVAKAAMERPAEQEGDGLALLVAAERACRLAA